MRDVYTCIRRIECDLPITPQEAEAVKQHFEAHQRRSKWVLRGFLVFFLCLGALPMTLAFLNRA